MIALPVVIDVTEVGIPGAFNLLVSACEATPVAGEAKYPDDALAVIVTK